jgi:HPt (histidine-containing phosphotransfer) domain-containing protein
MDKTLLFTKLIHIDGLDIWDGLSRVRCNRGAYAEGLRLFCQDAETQMAALKAALAEEDWKTYTLACHGLKGILAGIGAGELSQRALELERAAQQGDYGVCRSGTAPVLEILGGLAAALRFALSSAGENPRVRQKASVDFLEEKLDMLHRACSTGASREADSLAGELRTKTFDDAATDAFVEQLSAYVENLDYDLVLKSIEERRPNQGMVVSALAP